MDDEAGAEPVARPVQAPQREAVRLGQAAAVPGEDDRTGAGW
jgi:hypothetical protein